MAPAPLHDVGLPGVKLVGSVFILGGTLPGLAAAARLARVGHEVTLHMPDAAPTVADTFDLPAAWRDLFAKTGRPLVGTVGGLGLELVPAEVEFPTDRGEQWYYLSEQFGIATATRWRDFVDRLDDVWQALRTLGLEREFADPTQASVHLTLLSPRESVADKIAALDHPFLARQALAVLGDADPRATPAWELARLSVRRTFGTWWLVDREGHPVPGSKMVDALLQRVIDRGVRIVTSEPHHGADAVVDARPAVASWRPLRRGLFRRKESFIDQWLERPALRDAADPHLFHAPPQSRGGTAAWAQLLTGALATYAVHEFLTGEDIRPTNTASGRHAADNRTSQPQA